MVPEDTDTVNSETSPLPFAPAPTPASSSCSEEEYQGEAEEESVSQTDGFKEVSDVDREACLIEQRRSVKSPVAGALQSTRKEGLATTEGFNAKPPLPRQPLADLSLPLDTSSSFFEATADITLDNSPPSEPAEALSDEHYQEQEQEQYGAEGQKLEQELEPEQKYDQELESDCASEEGVGNSGSRCGTAGDSWWESHQASPHNVTGDSVLLRESWTLRSVHSSADSLPPPPPPPLEDHPLAHRDHN